MVTNCDALADMLGSIERFVNRLRIYVKTSLSMPAVDEVVVGLMVELICTLSLVTQKLKKRRGRESFLAYMLLYSMRRSQIGEEFSRG